MVSSKDHLTQFCRFPLHDHAILLARSLLNGAGCFTVDQLFSMKEVHETVLGFDSTLALASGAVGSDSGSVELGPNRNAIDADE